MITLAFFGALQSLAIGILGEYLLRNWFRNGLPRYAEARSAVAPGGNLSPQKDAHQTPSGV